MIFNIGVIISSMLYIILILYCIFKYTTPKLDSIDLETLIFKQRFKTGDIILFQSNYEYYEPLVFSHYGHIGIIYLYENIPYIFEASITSKIITNGGYNFNGIYCVPLIERLRRYTGRCIYKELAYSIDKNIGQDFGKFIDYCLTRMAYDPNIYYSAIKRGFGRHINHKVNCGELVFLSLIQLKLLPNIEYYRNVFHYLRWMCNIRHLHKNYYHTPIYISISKD